MRQFYGNFPFTRVGWAFFSYSNFIILTFCLIKSWHDTCGSKFFWGFFQVTRLNFFLLLLSLSIGLSCIWLVIEEKFWSLWKVWARKWWINYRVVTWRGAFGVEKHENHWNCADQALVLLSSDSSFNMEVCSGKPHLGQDYGRLESHWPFAAPQTYYLRQAFRGWVA